MAMDLLKIKPKELAKIFEKMFEHKKPIMVVGPPGIGKTDITHSVTKKLGYDMITMYPAISEPVDFRGMPTFNRETNTASFVPFDTLEQLVHAKKPTVCLVDDLIQANLSVQAAAMHMFLAREVGSHKISDHVTFVVCTNDKTHHAGGSGVIETVKSRMTSIVHLMPDLEDWVSWAIETGIRPEIIGFVRLRGLKVLSNFTPTMDLTNSPSPRGNKSVSDILNLELDDKHLEMTMIQGACGRGYAIEFDGFNRLFASLSDPRKILTDPDSVDVPENQSDVISAYVAAISNMAKPQHMQNIVKFARRLPIEFQVKLLQYDVKSADPENHATGAYTDWALDNQDIMKRAV